LTGVFLIVIFVEEKKKIDKRNRLERKIRLCNVCCL